MTFEHVCYLMKLGPRAFRSIFINQGEQTSEQVSCHLCTGDLHQKQQETNFDQKNSFRKHCTLQYQEVFKEF